MKLVEQHLLPILGDLIARILLSIEPRQRRPLLRVQHFFFAVAHVLLVVGLRRHHAAMVFKVEFALPRRNGNLARHSRRRLIALGNRLVIPFAAFWRNLLLDRCEISLRRAKLILRRDVRRAFLPGPVESLVQNRACRSAAMVAHAVQIQHVGHAGRTLAGILQILCEPHRVHRRLKEFLGIHFAQTLEPLDGPSNHPVIPTRRA